MPVVIQQHVVQFQISTAAAAAAGQAHTITNLHIKVNNAVVGVSGRLKLQSAGARGVKVF